MNIEKIAFTIFLALWVLNSGSDAQSRIYRSGGGEIILSSAQVRYSWVDGPVYVETSPRFTLFFHTQQLINLDLNNQIGLFAGAAIRNVGIIMEDHYQFLGFVDSDNEHWNNDVKVKRRSYSLGFPIALKLGAVQKSYFLYAGGEYEWMFHYKQKLFVDGVKKGKESEWTSSRVNSWIPSVFAGVQFPGGLNLKVKYYLNDFLNTGYRGEDFGQPVDYSGFESTGMWYISMAMILNREQVKKIREGKMPYSWSAYRSMEP